MECLFVATWSVGDRPHPPRGQTSSDPPHHNVLYKTARQRELHVGKFITCDVWLMNVVVLELGTINADIFFFGVRIPLKGPDIR
jgi:hypothetical protein